MDNDIIIKAAVNFYEIDLSLAPVYRSMDHVEFRALHDKLVELGAITPDSEFDVK